jgi:hypothetical protein
MVFLVLTIIMLQPHLEQASIEFAHQKDFNIIMVWCKVACYCLSRYFYCWYIDSDYHIVSYGGRTYYSYYFWVTTCRVVL